MVQWKVAAYVRLSSDDGDKSESNSITNQKSMINLFLKSNKDLKLKDFYIDDGFTGTDFDRPGFQRLLLDMKNDKINAIIVKDLSRLGRNYIEVGNYIEQIFPLYNIRFIAINDNVDSYKDPQSVNNVMIPFKNLMNDEYARDISNKVRSVLNTKKEQGDFIGSVAPYGYLRSPKDKHKFIVDPNAARVVKKIFNMALNGKSKKEIADSLNKCGILTPAVYQNQNDLYKHKLTDSMYIWNTKTLDRILQNRTYTGELVQGGRKLISHKVHKVVKIDKDDWIIIPDHHIALVSKNDFEQVQDVIYNRDSRVNKNNEYDIFSGHIRCFECGNSLTIRKSKKYSYYYCTSYIKEKECTKHSNNKNILEKKILSIINNQIDLMIDVDKKIDDIIKNKSINYDIEIISNRIKDIDEAIGKYIILKESVKKDLEYGYITDEDFEEYNNEYNSKLNKLKKEKNHSKKELERIGFKTSNNKEWINKFKENQNLECLNKKIIDELVDNIYVYNDGNIKIQFKYADKYIEAIDFINKHNCDIIKQEIDVI